MISTVNAYAKINLFLDIESLRDDGYHNIISLMQSIDLHDTVTVEYSPEKEYRITVSCSDESVPCNEKNLAHKAARFFPVDHGNINIHIEKRIPMQAGLAGGSADAAATLIALNELTGNTLTLDELKAIGNKLGADVPFCIETGAAIARGTGDILQKTATMPYLPIVVARKGEGMSTPEAYRALDRKYDNFNGYDPHSDLLNTLVSNNEKKDIIKYAEGLFNVFESVVEPCRPCVTELKQIMKDAGAAGSMMSGSGTSVFGIFHDEGSADMAVDILREKGAVAHLCYPLK